MSEHVARRRTGDEASICHDIAPAPRGLRLFTLRDLFARALVIVTILVGAIYYIVHETLNIVNSVTNILLALGIGSTVAAYFFVHIRGIIVAAWYIGRILIATLIRKLATVRRKAQNFMARHRGLSLRVLAAIGGVTISVMVEIAPIGDIERADAGLPGPDINSSSARTAAPPTISHSDKIKNDIGSNFVFVDLSRVPAVWPRPAPGNEIVRDGKPSNKKRTMSLAAPTAKPLSLLPSIVSLPRPAQFNYTELPTPIIGLADSEVPPIVSIVMVPPCLVLALALVLPEDNMRDCIGQPRGTTR